MPTIPAELQERLDRHRQQHLLVGFEQLDRATQTEFLRQLDSLDFEQLSSLFQKKDEPAAALPSAERIAALPVEAASDIGDSAKKKGEAALANGEVAVLLVAGGQGTRLGFDKPKGMYPVGTVSGVSLFQIHSEKVLALSRNYGKPVPFLIMTSTATHDDTVQFFQQHQFFGLDASQVHFFCQGTMPALDLKTGQLLLEQPGKLFLSPNGHGGTLTALADSGLLGQLKAEGVRHIFYQQVDNPLVYVADPAFLGRHIETESEASSKVVFKDRPEEKVGMLALVDGRCTIIEYSDMPAEMAAERDQSGELVYRAGNPAIHIFSVPFLERVTSGDSRLPFHLARKKVPYFDVESQENVIPTQENALKFELFIFDALPMADRWLAVSTPREEEFAPLKNASGNDSPETCKQLQSARFARWIEAAGGQVNLGAEGRPNFPIEISPLFALNAAELQGKLPKGFTADGPTHLK